MYPGNKREQFTAVGEDRLEILVKEPAERNCANERVKELVAEHYQVAVNQVRLISGHHGQRKIFSITKI